MISIIRTYRFPAELVKYLRENEGIKNLSCFEKALKEIEEEGNDYGFLRISAEINASIQEIEKEALQETMELIKKQQNSGRNCQWD